MNKIIAISIAIIFVLACVPVSSEAELRHRVRSFYNQDSRKRIERWYNIELRKLKEEYDEKRRKLRLLKNSKIEALEKR